MANPVAALEHGQEAYDRQAWGEAYEQLLAADNEEALSPADLERLAMTVYLTGRYVEHAEILERAHHAHLNEGDVEKAAHCAFWVGFALSGAGEYARGSGWFSRAQRMLDEAESECAIRGFLIVLSAAQFNESGDYEAAYARLGEAAKIGERFDDKDLNTLVRLAMGATLNWMGDVAAGVALLDEVMVTVTADEVSPIMVGTAYCGVIEECHQIYDLRRAHEWTAALSRWCSSHPDLVPYRGQCLVRRAEIMQLHGAWSDALEEARRAPERLDEHVSGPIVGAAYYLQGDLHRLRGDLVPAEEAYRRASECGHTPYPGLALLRLRRGDKDAANSAIRHALEESQEPRLRPFLLGAWVEILIEVGDIEAARAAADELAHLAADRGVPLLHAGSAHATGAVLLSVGDARGALAVLRGAWLSWQKLEAPYEAARSRVLVARACREVGDHDTAEMELDAASRVFEELGAVLDLEFAKQLSAIPAQGSASEITLRETEVLRLVATGVTNRAIAEALFISEKTVARHLSNIYLKLDLSTRAAATAYAYKHDIV